MIFEFFFYHFCVLFFMILCVLQVSIMDKVHKHNMLKYFKEDQKKQKSREKQARLLTQELNKEFLKENILHDHGIPCPASEVRMAVLACRSILFQVQAESSKSICLLLFSADSH